MHKKHPSKPVSSLKLSRAKTQFQQALALQQAGQLAAAESAYRKILTTIPDYHPAMHQLSLCVFQQSRQAEGIRWCQQAVAIHPQEAVYWHTLSSLYGVSGNMDGALSAARRVIELNPAHADAHFNIGVALEAREQFAEAAAAYRNAVRYRPNYPQAHYNLGNVLKKQGGMNNLEAAVAAYTQAVYHAPQYIEAHYNLGNALLTLEEYAAAEQSFRKVLQYRHDYETYNNLSVALLHLGKKEEAMQSVLQALRMNPQFAEADSQLAMLYEKQKRLSEAAEHRAIAHRLQPGNIGHLGRLLYNLQQLCDWREYETLSARLQQILTTTQWDKLSYAERNAWGAMEPFHSLSLFADPALQQRCARQYATQRVNAFGAPAPVPQARDKLRIGYLSADFREHALSLLMAELFELHDRNRFEIIAYCIGPDDNSAIRSRLKAGFDRFNEIKTLSVPETAARIRADEIDILVDLTGYTEHSRTTIMALRPAPVQVQFMGYAGTLGTPHVDYIIADPVLIPQRSYEFYDEKVVWLPDTYQCNDRKRPIAEIPSRSEVGLPEHGFVWCCFNNAYKITPTVFDAWMRLLTAVPDSMLWLAESNRWQPDNLRREAQARGIDPQRLIFAPKTPLLADHLARTALADLVLDTLPYGAHTTLSDALWAGVPAITCTGESFASRVGASLLNAAGLAELITDNLTDYENLAIALARNPTRLAAFRQQLQANRDTCALFDTPRFARHLETAYEMMWQRVKQGLPPDHLSVRP